MNTQFKRENAIMEFRKKILGISSKTYQNGHFDLFLRLRRAMTPARLLWALSSAILTPIWG